MEIRGRQNYHLIFSVLSAFLWLFIQVVSADCFCHGNTEHTEFLSNLFFCVSVATFWQRLVSAFKRFLYGSISYCFHNLVAIYIRMNTINSQLGTLPIAFINQRCPII